MSAGGDGPELDPLDFDEFFLRELPRLVALLTALTGQRAVAEELAQEALLRAHVRWNRISKYDSPSAWARRAALNLANNAWSRRRTESRLVARLGSLPPARETAAVDHEFWATVRQLPDRQATAVVLHYLDDLSVRDVAAAMGCAEGTAKAHLHKGRTNLALLLENPETTHGP
ncbi:MAG: SigE family RNA polymerase sigma factor [Aquihabitans sp.]